MYRFGNPRWDSGVTPPEVVAEIRDAEIKQRRALDLGCGTGTNSIFLARHGIDTVGVDFSPRAISLAQAKARRAGVPVQFHVSDVTRLDFLSGPFDFVLDIGCFHSLDYDGRARYTDNLLRLTCPDALYMLFAFGPRRARFRNLGVTPAEVRKLFGTQFALKRLEEGTDRREFQSAWYWFIRL